MLILCQKTHLLSYRLTAYVVKVFSMANSLVAVQKEQICNAVKYIILNSQRPDGRFIETGGMYHTEMMVCTPFLFSIGPLLTCPHNTQWHWSQRTKRRLSLFHFRVMCWGLIQTPPWQPSVSSPCRSQVHCAYNLWLWVFHLYLMFSVLDR